MNLKIVGGSAKGQLLKGPKNSSIRPAGAKLRESVFGILGNLEHCTVLDLFAGVGGMGIEALSRGAKEVTFVDDSYQATTLLFDNLKRLHFLNRAFVLKKSVTSAIPLLFRKKKKYDLIFFDPPYDQGWIQKTLELLVKYPLHDNTTSFLCEHSPREILDLGKNFVLGEKRKYGQTLVSFFSTGKSNG